MTKPVKVTVSDPETGAILEEKIVADDYCIVTAGRRYVKHVQAHKGGTHVLTVAIEAPDPGRPVPKHGSGP